MPRVRQLTCVLGAVLLLAATACTRDKKESETTPRPSQPPRAELVGDFQAVGKIDEAFAGEEPDVQIPDTDSDPDEEIGPDASPTSTPVGVEPAVGGILRITLEDISDEAGQACGLDAEDTVEVFWTTQTRFDVSGALDNDVEDEIEDRVAGVSGRAYRAPRDLDEEIIFTPGPTDSTEETEPADLASASPFSIGSPGADETDEAETDAGDCILVADQIGFERTLPTPRPVVRTTAAPTPVETKEPTPEPTDTPEPSETPSATSTATAAPTP
jgi:hypothetical protein